VPQPAASRCTKILERRIALSEPLQMLDWGSRHDGPSAPSRGLQTLKARTVGLAHHEKFSGRPEKRCFVSSHVAPHLHVPGKGHLPVHQLRSMKNATELSLRTRFRRDPCGDESNSSVLNSHLANRVAENV